ncbi:MAG: DcaP family trimeric outer membrane transporter [Pseudoalteromonas nigrifaciens]
MVNKTNLKITLLLSAFLSTYVNASGSDRVDEIEKKIELLQQSLLEVKKQQNTHDKVKKDLLSATPGYFSVLGSETEFKISGFVHLDAGVMESGSGINNTNFSTYAPILNGTVIGSDKKDTFDMSIRRSQLRLNTKTPIEDKSIQTHIEVDLLGSGGDENFTNSYDVRIRQAYVTYNGWLIGQTYTNFLNFASLGEIANLGQHANALFIRQTQVKYTSKFEGGSWSVSAENPYESKSVTISGDIKDTNKDDQLIPDLIGRIDLKGDWGTAGIAMMARKLVMDNSEPGSVDDSTISGAVSMTARFPIFKGSVGLQANYGALGRYLELGPYPDSYVENGELRAFLAKGASAVYGHTWRPGLRSTLALAYTASAKDLSYFSPSSIDKTSSLQANVFWDPIKKTTFGLEYGLYGIELANGLKQDVYRWQMTAQYNF